MKRCSRNKHQRGFTLIEVVIAMAIMAVAFTAILTSQSNSIIQTVRARETNVAGFLAHNLMVESEHLLEGKPFAELEKEETGNYPEPYMQYKWKREVKEIQFPDLGFLGGGDEAQQQIMISIGQAITKYLSNSIRELVITVSWPRGEGEQQFQLSTYLVDLNTTFDFSL